MEMIKVLKDDMLYYIYEEHFFKGTMTNDYDLMLYSQIVVNIKENKIIKCRNSITEIVDVFLKENL